MPATKRSNGNTKSFHLPVQAKQLPNVASHKEPQRREKMAPPCAGGNKKSGWIPRLANLVAQSSAGLHIADPRGGCPARRLARWGRLVLHKESAAKPPRLRANVPHHCGNNRRGVMVPILLGCRLLPGLPAQLDSDSRTPTTTISFSRQINGDDK